MVVCEFIADLRILLCVCVCVSYSSCFVSSVWISQVNGTFMCFWLCNDTLIPSIFGDFFCIRSSDFSLANCWTQEVLGYQWHRIWSFCIEYYWCQELCVFPVKFVPTVAAKVLAGAIQTEFNSTLSAWIVSNSLSLLQIWFWLSGTFRLTYLLNWFITVAYTNLGAGFGSWLSEMGKEYAWDCMLEKPQMSTMAFILIH